MTAVATPAPVAGPPHEADPLAAGRPAPVPDHASPSSGSSRSCGSCTRRSGRTATPPADGYVSIARDAHARQLHLRLERGELPQKFLNTLIVAVPAVIVTLFVSSMLGFVFSRFSFKANILLLMLFTAGNLLPPQVIIVPLTKMYLFLPLPKLLSDNGVVVRPVLRPHRDQHRLPDRASAPSCSATT